MNKTTYKEIPPAGYDDHTADPRTLEIMGDAEAGKTMEHSEIMAWVDGLGEKGQKENK